MESKVFSIRIDPATAERLDKITVKVNEGRYLYNKKKRNRVITDIINDYYERTIIKKKP